MIIGKPILLNSLDFMKHMERVLRIAPRHVSNGVMVIEIPATNADAWLEFLGKIIMATEARQQQKDGSNGG